jgi:hypothetical protein
LFAQIAVTNALPFDNEEYLVNSVLVGDDLTTSNFSSVGFANGIGYIDGNYPILDLMKVLCSPQEA